LLIVARAGKPEKDLHACACNRYKKKNGQSTGRKKILGNDFPIERRGNHREKNQQGKGLLCACPFLGKRSPDLPKGRRLTDDFPTKEGEGKKKTSGHEALEKETTRNRRWSGRRRKTSPMSG